MKAKEFIVCIDEIKQNFVFADRFVDSYTKFVTMSDGSTRTIKLTPTIHDDKQVVEINVSGHVSYMGLNGTTTKGALMVQIRDIGPSEATATKKDLKGATVIHWEVSLLGEAAESVLPLYGVELMNDDETPMEFVVTSLRKHLGLEQNAAARTMLAVHRYGRALVAVGSEADAARISEAMVADARSHSYPLVCRAISTPTSCLN